MDVSGSNSNMNRVRNRGGSLVRGRGRLKPSQSRRVWSNREEEILVIAMKGLIANNWKSDNGFRGGYLSKLEEAMIEAFPGTDIKGMPHINSKLTTWKRTYVALAGALSRSGVGFNERTNMIDCTDDTWDLIVKADKNTENMRYKSFPLYPAWIEMFGKDRANGQAAEDVMDAFTNLMREDEGGDYVVNLDNIVEEGEEQSVCGGELPEETSKSAKRRKTSKSTDELNEVSDMIRELVTNTSQLKDVAKYVGYEYGLGQKREMIFTLLSTIPGVGDFERYDLADILCKDSDRLEMFNGLPDDHKLPYLMRLLDRGH